MDVRTDPHGVLRISKVVAVIVGHAVLLEMLASASQKVVLDRGFDVEAFRILCFFVVFLGKDGTEAANEVIRVVLVYGGAVFRRIVVAFEEVVGELGLRFDEPFISQGFLAAIFSTGTESPVVKVSAVAVGRLIVGAEVAYFGDKVKVVSFITNLCCVKGHVGEVLIAVPVACVFTAASGVLNGTAVVPVAFRARVFFIISHLQGLHGRIKVIFPSQVSLLLM